MKLVSFQALLAGLLAVGVATAFALAGGGSGDSRPLDVNPPASTTAGIVTTRPLLSENGQPPASGYGDSAAFVLDTRGAPRELWITR